MDRNLMLRALADENRMKIVEMLLRHNMCVRSIANKLGITQAAVSQHVRVLREAGLVSGEKRGYFMHYEVNRMALKSLADHLADLAQVKKSGEHSCKCHENKEEI